jgi:hypothetical protein
LEAGAGLIKVGDIDESFVLLYWSDSVRDCART